IRRLITKRTESGTCKSSGRNPCCHPPFLSKRRPSSTRCRKTSSTKKGLPSVASKITRASKGGGASPPRAASIDCTASSGRGGNWRRDASRVRTRPSKMPEAARAEVRALKRASVEAVKVIFDAIKYANRPGLPAMTPEILAAILDEAHRHGLKVYAHASTLRYAKEFLWAGGDGLVHGI